MNRIHENKFVQPQMFTGPKISVCMATYNGAKYVEAQLRSVLAQLGPNDEIVIFDDHSTDDTVNIIKSLSDPRIRVSINGCNIGHVRNFEKCITAAKGQFIFLCDQDDIWETGRVELMISEMIRYDCKAVVSNLSVFIDENNYTIKSLLIDKIRASHGSFWGNIIRMFLGRTGYFGCAMAFHADLRRFILPIPHTVECHDHWIAMTANFKRTMRHVDQVTLRRRLHANNFTPLKRRTFHKIAKPRVLMLASYLIIIWRWITR